MSTRRWCRSPRSASPRFEDATLTLNEQVFADIGMDHCRIAGAGGVD